MSLFLAVREPRLASHSSCTSLAPRYNEFLTPSQVQAHATQPLSIRSTLQSPHSDLTHLIMVPGHAIWTGSSASTSLLDSSWILEPMQKGGAVKTFLKHITKGAELAVKDPKALLVFSGGQTRRGAEMTEAMSYARLARAGGVYDLWEREDILTKGTEAVGAVAGKQFDRVTTEVRPFLSSPAELTGEQDFALDSYENTLYAISRFKEFTGSYPTAITVVGYGMKRRRYVDVHRAALRWPSAAFTYIGIDNEEDKGGDYEGERRGGLEPFVRDSYGCKSVLLNKRRRRNVFRRFHGYHSSCTSITQGPRADEPQVRNWQSCSSIVRETMRFIPLLSRGTRSPLWGDQLGRSAYRLGLEE